MGREEERGPRAAESSPGGQQGLIEQLTARDRMRGLSKVAMEILCRGRFIAVLSSCLSTFPAALGSESITFHMAMATLQRHGALSAGTPWRTARLKALRRVLGPQSRCERSPKGCWAPYLPHVGEHCSTLATTSLGFLRVSSSRAPFRLLRAISVLMEGRFP